jgi:Fur family transcriptional regulator, iron response regulator
MPRPYSAPLARLRAAGLRPTRQRLALAKLLFDGRDRHVSAEALHAEAVAAGVKLSLATVYNSLHQFTHAGLLKEVVVDAARTYFDTNVGPHHHFFDEADGRLADIPVDQVSLGRLPAPPAGREIAGVDVVIRIRRAAR